MIAGVRDVHGTVQCRGDRSRKGEPGIFGGSAVAARFALAGPHRRTDCAVEADAPDPVVACVSDENYPGSADRNASWKAQGGDPRRPAVATEPKRTGSGESRGKPRFHPQDSVVP